MFLPYYLCESTMSTANQKNLVEKNSEYAENFKLGDLGPAPAKHYTIRIFFFTTPTFLPGSSAFIKLFL